MNERSYYPNRLAKFGGKKPSKRLSNRELQAGELEWEESKRISTFTHTLFNGLQKIRATTQGAYAKSLTGKLLYIETMNCLQHFSVVSPVDSYN